MIGYLTAFHVVVCILIVVLVLLQFGKGAEVGLFASSSENMFSSSQRKNVLARATTVLMILFVANSLVLARQQTKNLVGNSIVPTSTDTTTTAAPDTLVPETDTTTPTETPPPQVTTPPSATSSETPPPSP